MLHHSRRVTAVLASLVMTLAVRAPVAEGLAIAPTFDASITGDTKAAAIEGVINQSINIYQSLFADAITVPILFRYSTTGPDGRTFGGLAQSITGVYDVSWNSFTGALVADAKTTNDATANASLPASPLSGIIDPSSANGRAVGLNTPPAEFVNGRGPFDGIVTLNSAQPFQFTRPVGPTMFDAQRSVEHEINEVLGLGSFLNVPGISLRPQDLFAWSAPGTRNLTSSGSRYFSIDGGTTNIVGFNQDASGDFGDWLSANCPQSNPFVQNAFVCAGQASDVSISSPEAINLDVIGYDLIAGTESVPEPATIIPLLAAVVTLAAVTKRRASAG